MNIFGIGGAELFLIIVIMLVVAGPQRMIRWAYVLGVYAGKLRRMWAEVAGVLQKELDEAGLAVEVPKDIPNRQTVNKLISDVAKPYTDPVKQAMQEVEKPLKEASRDLDRISQEVAREASGKPPLPKANLPRNPEESLGSWGATKPEDTSTSEIGFGSWGKATNQNDSENRQ